MVIDARVARTPRLGGMGELADVAGVVVGPDQGHALGQCDARQQRQHVLVGHEDLGQLRRVAHMPGQQFALIGDEAVQQRLLVGPRGAPCMPESWMPRMPSV